MNTESQKYVLVTGAARGIGRAVSEAFGQSGWHVFLLDHHEQALTEQMRRMQDLGYASSSLLADLHNEQHIVSAMKQAAKIAPKLDALINNAGIMSPRLPLTDMPVEHFDDVIAVNLRAPFLCVKYALPLLEKAKAPAVVNMASTRALMSEANTFPYSASKGGILALTHAMAVSLGPKIRVNAVSPGWIEVSDWQDGENRQVPIHSEADCAQHPVGRVGRPQDIAKACQFLCSNESGFITGTNLVIDGGMTVKMIYVENEE